MEINEPLAEQPQFEKLSTEALNNWQKVARATNDVITPANAIDAVALPLSLYGLENIDSWKGIAISGLAFMADFVDGKVARKTGTPSALGEKIDAGGDKVKLAYAVIKLDTQHLAPKRLITAIAAQNSINVVLTGIDRKANKKDPVIHPSWAGKRAIFLQQWGLALHVVSKRFEHEHPTKAQTMRGAGNILGWAGVGMGIVATSGYPDTLWHARKAKQKP